MCPPTRADLPFPLPGRTGWPWTKESPPLPDSMPDGSPWPRVSVVTPSYNQGQFIEETIRSVLLQGYPNLEYIIVDGGSTDGSIDIIRNYEPWLSYWVSEKDRGQSHAINKGWARATGEIVAYLNSDDFYLPGALRRAADSLRCHPACALAYADAYWVNEFGKPFSVMRCRPLNVQQILTGCACCWIPQPTAFMRREAVQAVGGVDEALQMTMDFDLWIKLLLRHPGYYMPGKPLAAVRAHAGTKTLTRPFEERREVLLVLDRALADPLCPPGVTRVSNPQYLRPWLDLTGIFLMERRDLRSAVRYFASAVRYHPLGTFWQVSKRLGHRVYRAIMPPTWQAQLRHIRGTQPPEMSDVWN